MDKSKAVIVDRDGTLASVKYIAPTTRDNDAWRQYNAAMIFDAPVPAVVDLVRRYKIHGHKIIVVSGRMEGDHPGDRRRRFQMRDWLMKHGIPFDYLMMRAGGDTRLDSIVKAEMYDYYIAAHYDVIVVIDDREPVVNMWRSKGLKVIQVVDPGILPPIVRER
jgi:hypothetical protein